MFKQNTVRQALTWVPQIDEIKPVGAARHESANDEPFLPPPPPTLEARIANFGGRQRRYKEQRQQQLRVYDPFDQGYVTFSHDRYVQAWLLVRFCSSVTELDASPPPVGYLCNGRQELARPHLTWRTFGSERRVFFWLSREWVDEAQLRLKKFSTTHGVDVVLATWADLEAQKQMIDNLQAGRQRMANVHHAGLDTRGVAREVLRYLRAHEGRVTRGELGSELCGKGFLDCDAQVDAALFHLHAVGRVRLDIGHCAFGDDTGVRSA